MAWPRLVAVAACARVAAGAVSSGCGVESTDILEYVGMESLPLSINEHNHVLTLPRDYDYETPVPLILYLHGWGGDASEGDAFASTARKKGIATAALEGGGPAGWQSWNAGGSSSSPGPRGATCKPGSTDYCSHYTETCDCDASDGCWWTTCEDSTQVLLDALEAVKKMLCVDLDQVWVAGCSNGAMMVYEALADERTAGTFAGGVSIVGAPHPGFWRPPASPAHLLGIWGLDDTTIPYEASEDAPGPGVALATVDEADERGWYVSRVLADNEPRRWRGGRLLAYWGYLCTSTPSSRNTTLAQSSPSPTPSLRVLTPSDAPQVLHGRAQRDAGVEPPPRRPRRARRDQCLRKWRRVVRHVRRRLQRNRRVYSKSWPRLRPRRRDRDRARVYSRKTRDLLR